MDVQRTSHWAMRVGSTAHPCLSLPPQLAKPWSRSQRRSCVTHRCLLHQPVLSKEVKDQEGIRLMAFQRGKGKKGKASKERLGSGKVAAKASSEAASLLILCSRASVSVG